MTGIDGQWRQYGVDVLVKILGEALLLVIIKVSIVNDVDAERRAVLAPDFDPRRGVITADPVRSFYGAKGDGVLSSVDRVSRQQDEMRFNVTADQDGLMVFDETYYPGWKAEVDGSPAPVIRADYAFMAVSVTHGGHDVRFTFAPPVVRVGGILSGVSALAIVGILIFFAGDLRRLLSGAPHAG